MPKLQGKGSQSKPAIVRAKDISDLYFRLANRILWGTPETLAYYSSIDVMLADVLGIADTCNFDLNIGKDVWLTIARWNTLLRQYVDPEKLFKWLESVKRISTYNRGITALDFNVVRPTVVESNARANRRKEGACLRMITYRAFPQPTVSLYSRTSYLGYIAALDLMLGHKLAQMAADMIGDGLKPNDIAFRWHVDVGQFHGFKSMAFIFHSKQDKYMRMKEWPEGDYVTIPGVGSFQIGPEENYKGWKIVRSWWKRIKRLDQEGRLYSGQKYGAEIRIRRRYHAMMGIDDFTDEKFKSTRLPDIPMDMVNLDMMTYSTPESRAIIRRKKKQRAEQLVKELFSDDELLTSVGGKLSDGQWGQLAAYAPDDIVSELEME
jgi:hypothetical protein